MTPERFQSTLTAFFDLLSEVSKAVTPDGERLEWRVQVKQGSNLVGVVAGPGVSASRAAQVRQAMVSGLHELAIQSVEPPAFSERALASVRRLGSALGNRKGDDTAIQIWGQREPVPITHTLHANVVAILAEAHSDRGSVEGRLKTVSVAGGFRIVLYEPVFGAAIRCDVPEHLMGHTLALFDRRVEVYGVVHYRRNGTVSRVSVEEIVPFPAEDELPSPEDVRGILRGTT